jgi:hypothetical protein
MDGEPLLNAHTETKQTLRPADVAALVKLFTNSTCAISTPKTNLPR